MSEKVEKLREIHGDAEDVDFVVDTGGNRANRRLTMKLRPRAARLLAYGKRRGKYNPWWGIERPVTFFHFKRHAR